MVLTKARKVGLIAVANLVVGLTLLTTIELAFRRWEQARINRYVAAEVTGIPPKGPSEIRVFAFGGSTVWGAPVPEVAYVAQVQYWLHRLYPNRNIRVYNFGAPMVDAGYVLRQLTRWLDDQPDLVIVETGGNEFFAPNHRWYDHLQRTLSAHFATIRLLGQFGSVMMQSRELHVLPCQVDVWDRESAAYKSRIADINVELNQIVKRVRRKGVPLILCTLPSNLSDWPPAYKRLPGRGQPYAEMVSGIQELLRGGKYQEASDAVAAGFSRYPQDAMLYFLRGRIQVATGAYADARESFVKARDLDPVPFRPCSEINSLIRRAASGFAGVYLVDMERAFEEHSNNGLVGFDFMADNCHRTPLGESVAAQAIIEKMLEIGFLPPAQKPQKGCCPVNVFLADAGYLEPKSPLRFQALFHNGIYVMRTPFLYYEASHRYLLEAKEVNENSWQVWANLATLSYFKGDNATGAKELQRATELHGKPINADDLEAAPYLKEALEYAAGHGSNCGAPF